MSPDTLDDAERALATFAARLPIDIADVAAIAAVSSAVDSPAARFAIETALLAALGRVRISDAATSTSHRASGDLAGLYAALRELSDIRTFGTERADIGSDLVLTATLVDTPEQARAAAARCLKIKVGPAGDLDRVRAIAAAAPSATLRLDANQSWPRESVMARLATLADLPIEYIEEPCPDAHELLETRPAVPIALDESLATMAPPEIARALASPGLAALVLKPTLLGLLGAAELARQARAAGKHAVVTHALEGPIGTAACTALAHAVGSDVAMGLAPHPALAAWRARSVVAMPSRATIAEILAAFSDGVPIALLHHALPPAELERRRGIVERAVVPPDTAFVLFTSGSTGAARGVVLSRAAVIAAAGASAARLGWRDHDRWLVALSLAHAGGLAALVRCTLAGKPYTLLEPGDSLAHALAQVTLASLVPTQLAMLLDDPAWRPSPQLRVVLLGGAAASRSLLVAAAARGVPVLPTYGMTESFGQLATAPLAHAGDPDAPLVPLPGVELVAGTASQPAAIRVRAPMLATCYLDGAPIAPELVTADLGYLEGDTLHVVGRADEVIVTGGENVHPATVEAVLAATPGVRAACAFGIADARWGQIVGAAIAVDARFDRDAIAAWHTALPPHARPRELAITGALPMLPTGKLDRLAAAQLPREPVRYQSLTGTI